MLGEYCGFTLPPNLVSSTNSIFIHFNSDGSDTRNGFNLEYNDLNCDAPIELIRNGVCNDEANNEGCLYDGGDCCLLNTNSDQCTECICYHQETCAAGVTHPLVGDGYCQDETNNGACNYDGGDCCGSCVVTEHCTECQCLGGVDGIELSNPLIGDGYCQDETNNAECNYDGGDCCGSCVNTEHCTECQCLGGDTGNGVINPLVGDGYCQDETNNAECYYDGQDCCGSLVNRDQCSECICHSMYFLIDI